MKSFFFVPAVAVSTVLMLTAVAGAITGNHDRVPWLAAAVANMPLPLFWLRLRVARVPRTSSDLPLLILISAGGSVVVLWEVLMSRSAEWQPAAIAVSGTVLLLLYVFWYSRFGRVPNARLAIRNKLPEFELTDLGGNAVPSSQFLGAPTVWLFYRGNWDPFCVAQVHEIASRHADLERLGAQLNVVSSQPADRVRELAGELAAPVRFLMDRNAKVAEALDIAERHPIPPGAASGYFAVGSMPTTIVTNASGTILFTDQTDNYRVRPEPDIYISILRRAGAVTQ
jgi:peroxiredoxin